VRAIFLMTINPLPGLREGTSPKERPLRMSSNRRPARRLQGACVTANAMAPGLIPETGLYRDAPADMLAGLRQRSARTSSDGADAAVWLAGSPEIEGVTGKLFENGMEIPCSFRNRDAEERLWSIREGLVS
jgi:hypothetical protein